MDLGLKGRSVLVTGGNRGIGLAISLAFAGEGANVAICGRDKAALAEAEAKIAAKGVKAKAISADLFTAAGCRAAVAAPVEAFGGLDVLVNNASTAVSGNIETLDDDGLMERLNGKTLAYMRCCRAALPHLRKSKRGRVICIGGTAARHAGDTALPSALGNSAISPSSSSSAARSRARELRRTSFIRPSPRPIAIRRAARHSRSNSASAKPKPTRDTLPSSRSAASWSRRTSRPWCSSSPHRMLQRSRAKALPSTAARRRAFSTE